MATAPRRTASGTSWRLASSSVAKRAMSMPSNVSGVASIVVSTWSRTSRRARELAPLEQAKLTDGESVLLEDLDHRGATRPSAPATATL